MARLPWQWTQQDHVDQTVENAVMDWKILHGELPMPEDVSRGAVEGTFNANLHALRAWGFVEEAGNIAQFGRK